MKIHIAAGSALGVAIGLAIGMGLYTFVYAKGWSYLTNDPQACANCHVMKEQFDGWAKSTHHKAAVCNDCHMPHALIPKYMAKAKNGFFHSLAFTTGDYPDVIQIKQHNRELAEHACLSCHQDIVQAIQGPHSAPTSCLRCHHDVGHR